MGHVSDFGGNRYGKRARVSKATKENTQSFRCRDCDKLRYVTPRELLRAARPRCLGCGGTLIEGVASARRTLGTKTERKEAAAKTKDAIDEAAKLCKCWSCGFSAVSPATLAGHLSYDRMCRRDYVNDKKITDDGYCIGTAHMVVCTPASRGYEIRAVRKDGELVPLPEKYHTQAETKPIIDRINSGAP